MGSLIREDRLARVEVHKRADPDKSFQRIGYDYLADEKGLKLEAVPPGSLWPD